MLIRVGFDITLDCQQETPVILALYPHPSRAGDVIGSDAVRIVPPLHVGEFQDIFDNRCGRVVLPAGTTRLHADFLVRDDGRPDEAAPDARQLGVADLPNGVIPFLAASRYCESDELTDTAWRLFGDTPSGWPRVQAICDWVHRNVAFGYAFGSPTKTALSAYRERTGVCRDFAHLAIAFCRAMNIPARYAGGWLGDIGIPPQPEPGDFCAWMEVYLGGRWYTFDARYNVPRVGRVLMVRGRDAADVAMLTTFGANTLSSFSVWCDEVRPEEAQQAIAEVFRHAAGPGCRAPAFRPAQGWAGGSEEILIGDLRVRS